MAPVEHPVEFGAIDEVALERRQKYLRGIAEDDDAQGYRKVLHVHGPLDPGPAPVADVQEAVADDDDVDEEMGHRAPEAQDRDVVQGLEEAEGQEEDPDEHHPASGVDGAFGEDADHEVAADDDVEDASHEEFDDLGDVDGSRAQHWPEALLGYGDVRVANPHPLAGRRVQLVQTFHQDLAGVAADVGYSNHGEDGPVTATQHGEGQRDYEHSLENMAEGLEGLKNLRLRR